MIDLFLITLYSFVLIGLILFSLYKKNKVLFISFSLFVRKNIISLFCFFLLNIIWTKFLIFAARPGIEVWIILMVLGIPVWLINSFILQPLLFNRLVKNSKWTSRYMLYMVVTPFIFRTIFDFGLTHLQIIGGVLLNVIIPMCFLIFINQSTCEKKNKQRLKSLDTRTDR